MSISILKKLYAGLSRRALFTAWRCLPEHEQKAWTYNLPLLEQRLFDDLIRRNRVYSKVFDQHKVIFIHVPKAAGSSVTRALFDLDNQIGHLPLNWYERMDSLKFEEYFKFAFVRNPWDRFISAYHFLRQGGIGPKDEPWAQFLQQFDSVEHFITSWLEPDNVKRNLHFLPQHEFITNRYGAIGLDFMGRTEEIEADLLSVAEKLGKEVQMPHVNASKRNPYQQYYSERSRDIVAEVYAKDIKMLGYSFDKDVP